MKTRELQTKETNAADVVKPPAKPEVFPCPLCRIPTVLGSDGVNYCNNCGNAFKKREVDTDLIDKIFARLDELDDDAELFEKEARDICKGLLSRTQITRAVRRGELKRRRGREGGQVITVKALRTYLEAHLGGVVEE